MLFLTRYLALVLVVILTLCVFKSAPVGKEVNKCGGICSSNDYESAPLQAHVGSRAAARIPMNT